MASFLDTIDIRYGGTIVDGVAKKRAAKVRNPLEPLATFNWMVLCLVILFFIADVITTLLGSGSFWGWGHKADICVTDTGISGGDDAGASSFVKPHPGVSLDNQGLRLCTSAPSTAQRWWYTMEYLPGMMTLVVVVLTTYVALRQAQRHGLYTPGFASKLRFLGWFLVAAALLSPTIATITSRELWATMADSERSIEWNVTWTYLFPGLALLSLARIMRVGSAMREDLEGVV